jgi:hypothetical protein
MLPLSAVLFAIAFACGAENMEAPRAIIPDGGTAALMCKGFEQLMPNFLKAIDQGRTENLRKVIKDHLLVPEREGDPPPINDVMRSIFATLTKLATEPAEPGAPGKELCAVIPPPLSKANEMCEVRRILDSLVHQGKGIATLELIDPQATAIVNYIIGKGKDGKPHYEVAQVLSAQCSQDVDCQLSTGLDLVIALTNYLETVEGKKLVADLEKLTAAGDGGPSILDLLNPNALAENDAVGLSKVLLGAVQSATPADLDALLNNPLLSPYKVSLGPIIEDLKVMLDPNRPLIAPMRKVLNCVTKKDPNSEIVRMLYRLALGPNKLPEFGFTKLVEVVNGVKVVDERGALIHIIGTIAGAVRQDEQAIDSAAKVCRTLLSTKPAAGQTQSNAQLALPVIADLFAAGIVAESICAIDTLVFGCTGGPQPACMP